MKKKGLIAVLSIALFLFVAQPCRAVRIDYIGGNLFAKVGTDDPNAPGPLSESGWNDVGELTYNFNPYAHATANGSGIVGGQTASFTFNTAAQSNTYNSDNSFTTYSIVGTGDGSAPISGNLLEFEIVAETPAEEDWAVNLSADIILSGTLNSGGDPDPNKPPVVSGTSSLEYIVKIFKDPDDSPVLSDDFSESFTSDLILDGSDPNVLVFEEWIDLNGTLGLEDTWSFMNEGSFRTGDRFRLYFRQIAQAYVPGDLNSSSKAYDVQSINDVTIKLSANRYKTLPIPEPSIIILLGSLIIGFAIIERRRYRSK